MAIGILDISYYIPPEEIPNSLIGEWSGASDEWIHDRTGITTRRYAADSVPTSVLAAEAARKLLDCDPSPRPDLAAIIVATSTPDHPQPATAAIVQSLLGFSGVPAFDVNAVCSGFLYALRVASALVRDDPRARPVLVIAADKYSTIMDRTDRRTVTLFGDGAGAALVGSVPEGTGLVSQAWAAHGILHDLVKVPAGGTRLPADARSRARGEHFFKMDGRGVREYALDTVPALLDQVLAEARIGVSDVDRFIFHQGNPRLVEALATKVGADPAKVPITADRYGNAGAASLPITLAHTHQQRPIHTGETILLAGLGGGMTSGAALLRWHNPTDITHGRSER